MFFPGYGGVFPGGGVFEQSYHVYPVSFIEKPHLENGDKVIMPPSALDRLASLHIDYPMLFEVDNPAVGRKSHCGVLEFIADEGVIYMPYWMMQNLLLEEGDLVKVKSATLPKGTYVKLQPHTKDFLDISNPKAVLETTLRNFSCLTVGDNIMVAYNNKKYYIDIIEAKPSGAISIIETDCEVDFAPPLDYVEPERPPPQQPATANPGAAGPSAAPAEEAAAPEAPSFAAFTGSGRRLDGKPSKLSAGPVPPPAVDTSTSSSTRSAGATASGKAPAGSGNGASSAPAGATAGSSQAAGPKPKVAGKLVFGAGGSTGNGVAAKDLKPPPREKGKEVAKEDEEKKPEPSFKAFTGKGYSLKG